jgi:GIY-YIG catalytic domain-containing protein
VQPAIVDQASAFLRSSRLYAREEALGSPSPIPLIGGVYGWWFRVAPAAFDTSGCHQRNGLILLYTGISPRRPPRNGRAPSKSGLRKRIQTHYAGNAEGSTLRKTLGCLLADELGIQLRRVGSGNRRTFVHGEQALSSWMAQNALVSFVTHDQPWELEDQLIATLDLPLNLEGNSRNRFHPELTRARARCVAQANALPVLPNPSAGGR